MATKKRKTTTRRAASRKKRAEQRLPAGLGTLFAGLLLVVLAFVEGDSAWKALHDVLFGLFGCGSFVLGAAVCCLAVQYTRGEDLLPKIFKLVLGLVFACGTVIVFSDIQPQGMSAFQMTAACYANGVNAWIGGGALGALLGGSLLLEGRLPAMPKGKILAECCALGLWQTTAQYAFFYSAVALLTGAFGGILNSTQSFLGVIFAHFLYGRADRMTPAKGFVHDMDWADFSAQPLAGSNEHPPLFADMLRTVAETNPDTPLIVEIKSRAEYSKTYLEELCRATIAELKAYPGPYCIESFDPRVVGIVRRQAPDILRGQLADSYQSYRKDGTHAVPAFAFSHLFGNFLGRPDFIAWCPAKRNWAVKLNAALGAMMVMWTALPEHDTAKLEAENDAVIFQWYAPKQKYRE